MMVEDVPKPPGMPSFGGGGGGGKPPHDGHPPEPDGDPEEEEEEEEGKGKKGREEEEEDAQEQASMACPFLLCPGTGIHGCPCCTWISGALHLLSSKGEQVQQCNP